MKTSHSASNVLNILTLLPTAALCLSLASVLSGCQAEAPQSLNGIFPDLGNPPSSHCPDLSGRFLVNGLNYSFEQLHCDRVKIATDCTVSEHFCQQMGYPAHAEAVVFPDGQEREIASQDPRVQKLYETASFDESSLTVSRRKILTSGRTSVTKTRYIRKANPCGPNGHAPTSDVLGIETTQGNVSQCVSGGVMNYEIHI